MNWQVTIKEKVVKDLRNRRKIPIQVESAMIALLAELEVLGPAVNWPNDGKLRSQGRGLDRRHCHLQKGPDMGCLLGGR